VRTAGAGLVESTVSLCRALRDRGLLVTTAHAFDAVRALRSVDLSSKAGAYHALKCVLASRPEDFETFDELFEQMFAPQRQAGGPRSIGKARKLRTPQETAAVPSLDSWGGPGATDDEPEEVPGASDARSVADKDFSAFGSQELDLRRTLRASVGNSGEVLDLRFRSRKPRKTRIVALCDVSGSMDLYSRFLLQFLFALQGSVARVESFVFATELRRITDALRGRSYGEALRELSHEAPGWSGGTRIGESLAAFNADYGRLVDRRTVVIVLSDGWDTGDPAILSEAVQLLRRRSRRLVWLNPLLGSPEYEPLTVGMQAALPHVSVFAPAHNLASLRALERHLR
jgi:uncharacterized protein with von Willebrand factor type A (vWA) domain